jgi:hypothetical protein
VLRKVVVIKADKYDWYASRSRAMLTEQGDAAA